MVVKPVTSGTNPFHYPKTVSRIYPANMVSTLTTIQEFGRKPSSFSKIKKWVVFFWTWLLSWIPRRNQPEPKDSIYFKIEDGEEGVNKYRLLRDGKRTENIVRMGESTVYLNEFSFPDSSAFQDLPSMLKQIMTREHIDVIQTKNLGIAKQLWKCGLKTDSTLTLSIPCSIPIDSLCMRIVNTAMEKRDALPRDRRRALEKVEEKLVMAVVTDAFTLDMPLPAFFQREISLLERAFPKADLQGASDRLRSSSELPAIQSMVLDFQNEISCAVSQESCSKVKVDFPISLLFTLASAMDIPFDRELGTNLDRLLVFKKEKK